MMACDKMSKTKFGLDSKWVEDRYVYASLYPCTKILNLLLRMSKLEMSAEQ